MPARRNASSRQFHHRARLGALALATLLASLAALIVLQPFGPFKPIAEAEAK